MFDDAEQDYENIQVDPLFICLNHEFSWLRQFDYVSCEEKLSELVTMAIDTQNSRSSIEQNLNSLLDSFYSDWAFSGTSQKVPISFLNSVAYTLHCRTGSNISLGMILIHVMEQLGFDVELMVFENDIQVLLKVSPVEGYLIDPCSGAQRWYITPENDSDDQLEDAFQQLFDDDLEKLFLAHQKWAFISEKKYGEAFRCVEKLMVLTDSDPYEIRDRGYLLQNLKCDELAIKDFETFIEECPDDPSIELIQSQIEEMDMPVRIIH
jgi:regulator of sirC expression with transglutaminase-like and TPR domain